LRQVDFDGRYTYSESVAVQSISGNDFTFVFASPAETTADLVVGFDCNSEEPIKVLITDAVGNLISTNVIYPKIGFNRMQFDMPSITSGIYFITLANSSDTSSKKVFVK